MSERSYVKNSVIYDCGFPKSLQEISDIINNLEDIATKWQHKSADESKQIADLQHRLEVAKKALELACEELMSDLEFNGELDKHYNLQANIEYFKTKAREIVKSE